MKNVKAVILLVIGMCKFSIQGLPPTVKVCRRNDPKISDCIRDSIIDLQPRLASGDLGPGLRIPPQEPLDIGDIAFGDSQNFHVKLKNVTARGGSKFTIEQLHADMNELKMDAVIFYPNLELAGRYEFNANLFLRPIKNDGDIIIKLTNSVNRIIIKMQKYHKNGIEYLRFEDVELKIKSKKPSSVQINGIFENKALNDIASALIQENPIFSAERITPYFEKSLSESMTRIANNIVSSATYDEVFPL